jgi:hypothetical protein
LKNKSGLDNSYREMRKDNIIGTVAFEILKNIADYPFDLFKIRLKGVVSELIDIDILKFVQFMEHRIR